MKINTDHKFFAPVFKQIAELLEDDYILDIDSTDQPLGLSLTVLNKKYKSHGLNISTYLGENPEWKINAYSRLSLELAPTKSYRFTPIKDAENFPILSDSQIEIIKKQIVKIDKAILDEIISTVDSINNGEISISTETINHRFNDGFDDLINVSNYDVKINYEEYFLITFGKSLTMFRLVQGIFNSKNPEIRNLLEQIIDLYIESMHNTNIDDAYTAANRFSTVDRSNSILGAFTKKNEQTYLEMVKVQVTKKPVIDDYDIIGFIRAIESNTNLTSEIYAWAYEYTQYEKFLPDSVKDIFLF